jgi:nucleotide-binding universal stress UspA family protein
MKIKPARKRGQVVVELGNRDAALLQHADGADVRMTNLLVPVDFSENSRKSFAHARALARAFGARLHLLHAVQVHYAYGEFGAIDYGALERDMRAGAKQQLAALAGECGASGIPAATHVVEGSPARAIAEAAERLQADLIVISTHGYTGLKHVLLGSIAEAVVRHAPCPVLVVPVHEKPALGDQGA